MDVVVAGLDHGNVVECSRGVKIQPDVALDTVNLDSVDMVILPGGMAGAKAFAQSEKVKQILNDMHQKGKWIAAICAAPIALHAARIGFKSKLTSHPVVQKELTSDYHYSEERVVVDGHLITR